MAYILLLLTLISAGVHSAQHGFSTFATLGLPATFSHYPYANPNAPKGGDVKLATLGTFDSLNPFILKGVPATGITLCFATLLDQSLDEPASGYGYVAESVQENPEHTWVIFNLNPKAVFSDGSPITADDVIFTFNTLKEKGNPKLRNYYQVITHVEKLSTHSVKFHYPDNKSREIPLILGQLPVLCKKFHENKPFDETTLTPPVCSGPYIISAVDPGRSITYVRVKNWWGENIPSQKGFNNFDSIRYEYYRDSTAMFEAFKNGQSDYRYENISRQWATAYDFPAVRQCVVKKELLPNRKFGFTYGLFFNTRRAHLSDVRVRQALTLLFDFEWANKNLFFSLYNRSLSYFFESDFDEKGKITPPTKEVLAPYADRLPKGVLTDDFVLPVYDSLEKTRTIKNQALMLLEEAGFHIVNQKLVNKQTNQPFTLEFLLYEAGLQRIALHYQAALKQVGIDLSIRQIDVSSFQERIDHHDYDMVPILYAQSQTPGNEQRNFWGSAAANQIGSLNVAGINDPIVDELIEKIIAAQSYDALKTFVSALDRVLLFGYYMIPCWGTVSQPIAYWDRFGKPATLPFYSSFHPTAWWIDLEKDMHVQAFRNGATSHQGFLSRMITTIRKTLGW